MKDIGGMAVEELILCAVEEYNEYLDMQAKLEEYKETIKSIHFLMDELEQKSLNRFGWHGQGEYARAFHKLMDSHCKKAREDRE